MTQSIQEAAHAAPDAVLWAIVGVAALLLPVVMLAWGAVRGFAADLSSHPSPFRARLIVAAKASVALPAAVAAGFLLFGGGWWSAGSPFAELGPAALVLGLTLWFALSACARFSAAARFVAAGARQSRADSRRFRRTFDALKDADPLRAEEEAAWALGLPDPEVGETGQARNELSETRARLRARAEDFEDRTALFLGLLAFVFRLLEPRSAPEDLREILIEDARLATDGLLRPHDRDVQERTGRERLAQRASSLARRRSPRLALWHAAMVRRDVLADRLEGAEDFLYALDSRLRPGPPYDEAGPDGSQHETEGVPG